ncbi:cupin domain-containing protein [Porifericola rhodea]|uniref:cupin domain-containing protein n=1 Tax=Porifericola rhodea TaxID=930972 RepID=UPI0026669111|nr:cupin domain-containing protein [Porifericola rhodea]WKN33403.1 cupin domain-containing protein [Porifericola rhodea]
MEKNAQYWIDHLDMQPHPEGGYYTETYRSAAKVENLDRPYSTAIYFLLLEDKFSAFHRIRSDEMWHFYAGNPIEVLVLEENGALNVSWLGNNPERGEQFQLVVPAGLWFASRMARPTSYGLVGCTVAPGFDFRDFEMAKRSDLIKQYPQHSQIIEELTYPKEL